MRSNKHSITFVETKAKNNMKNVVKKIKASAEQNGLLLHISGDMRTKVFYSKVLDNPYKIISPQNSMSIFLSLCSYLVKNKKGVFKRYSETDYVFTFIEDDLKVEIQRIINGNNIICLYKIA